jgi:2-C-methyl-D-erythritol 2,4-cyclodiphosphate synthase
LLQEANGRLAAGGYKIGNIDATVVCEQPRLADQIDDMVSNISGALNIEEEQVSIKACSANGVGSLGKGDGIAAYAVALIDRSNE